ncbi:hypothetical protein Acr_12g0006310 [Actinidia rufa]|uniref:Uncharacterized protein n=1 Tax=Actinidia rufa TaxID=165716 RepID=A0A7J0FHC0_9ERIC|nr:hypothetical protein Acr_12g0006310 [Actinidia rufa]
MMTAGELALKRIVECSTYLRMMGERPLYRSKLEIRVEIFRRDFRAIQLRKCIPDSGGIWWRFQVFYLAQRRGGDSTLALGELMSTPMVALASSVEMTWRSSMDSFYLGQEGSEISNLWEDHGRPVLRWRGIRLGRWGFYPTSVAPYSKCRGGLRGFRVINDNYGVNSKQRHVALQTDTLAGALNADMVARLARSDDLDSLPSWISDHLGQGSSYMADEVDQSPSSPVEGSPEENPLIAIHPSVEEKTNIMTIEELNALREIYSFPPELVPNAWRSITCSMALWRVYKYSLSLSEFRNLFSLSCNPKPDQGWLYFKARNKKVLLGGYPSNVKGWKSKFFFVSGDEWEIPAGTSPVGAPRVPRTWGIPDKHYNNQPRLFGDEMKVFDEAYRTSRTAGDNRPSGEAPSSSSDVGESKNPHDQARRESPSRDDSIECLGSIRTNLRRLLPHIPDLTLLRWLGGKVRDPILDRSSNDPSLNSLSESRSDSSLPVELESDAMSKRVSFKKIGEKLGKAAGASPGTPAPAKGVVIGDKQPGESITSSPSKKGKADDGSKGKGVSIAPEAKKKTSSKAPTVPAAASPRPGEADKEKVDKLTLDQTATKLFHVIGQALVLGSSLAVRSREAGELASLQEGRAASMETEIARLQKVAADLDQQLAESRAREQHTNDELAKAKSDRDSLSDQCGRSGVLVNELREALNKSKDSAVEEFKSSSEFMVAVEDATSKYFGEGFNFCKVQLRRHHPDLAIDLEGAVVDQDLLAELDEADEENEKTGEKDGGKK